MLLSQSVYQMNQRTENLNLLGTYRVLVENIRSTDGTIVRRQKTCPVRYLGSGRWLLIHERRNNGQNCFTGHPALYRSI